MNELRAPLLFSAALSPRSLLPDRQPWAGKTRDPRVTALPRRPHPAETALHQALDATAGALRPDQVALAACLFARPPRVADPGAFTAQPWWGYRAQTTVYPASVMKVFVLAALAAFRAEGRLPFDAEDDRAAAAMIRLSSNEATAYLMGRLTQAEDGGNLGDAALAEWCRRRAAVQDWFQAQARPEFAGLQLLHATYQDSPYGRAFQSRRPGTANRLSALASAALMHDIARGALAGASWMMDLLHRDFQRAPGYFDPEGDQVRGFLAEGLPSATQVWSKAGHTSATRHDLVYAENPDGTAFVLSVMTEGAWASRDQGFLPALARAFHAHAFPAA